MDPQRLRIVELHPGGGQYDCLTVIQDGRAFTETPSLQLNRVGRAHVFGRFDARVPEPHIEPDSFSVWQEHVSAEDPVEHIRTVARRAGIEVPPSLPASTRRSLTYRVIDKFVRQGAFRTSRWDCRNGFGDTSGYGGGVADEWFAHFPEAQALLRNLRPDALGSPAYRFWFLLRDWEPLACLYEGGPAWAADGRSVDLMRAFEQAQRRVLPVLLAVLGAERLP